LCPAGLDHFILSAFASTPEARQVEKQAPQTTSGFDDILVAPVKPIKFVPTIAIDNANRLAAGGRLEITPRKLNKIKFNTITVEGKASSMTKSATAAISGSKEAAGIISRMDWRLGYDYNSSPIDVGTVKSSRFAAQLSGISRPLLNDKFTVRFGGLLEAGNQQSSIVATSLGVNTLSNSAFGAVKLYVGLGSRLRHNVFSGSYGLQIGSTEQKPKVDWVKHIANLNHDFWYPIGNHRILDLESKFSAGFISANHRIPVSEKFFGANIEKPFIPNDNWHINENPVFRAIPGKRFNQGDAEIGTNKFLSYSLTASYTVWRVPLVPTEITNDPDFNSMINAGISSANDPETYLVMDQHFKNTYIYLNNVKSLLSDFDTILSSLKSKYPAAFTEQFKQCSTIVQLQKFEIKNALMTNATVVNKFPVVEGWANGKKLNRLVTNCVAKIRQVLPNEQELEAKSNDLANLQKLMESEFNQIDTKLANSKVKSDSAFVKNTLNTLLYDVNLYSLSPVFVFDAATIGPKRSGFGRVRYGSGLGIKLELANSVNFTAGYAWNLKRRQGEGRGNLFFSLSLRDLFSF
jgi:hypothetical protein